MTTLTTQTLDSCFENLIGLRSDCSPVSKSGLFLDDIGITPEMIKQIITSDYSDEHDFFTRKYNFSVNTVVNKIASAFASKYKLKTLLENKRVGILNPELSNVSTDAGYLYGLRYKVTNSDSYLDNTFSSISLWVNTSGTYDLKFYDLKQNKLLKTISVTCVSGEVLTIYPNQTFVSDKRELDLLLCYNPSGAEYINGSLSGSQSCSSCTREEYYNGYAKISAVKVLASGQIISDNLLPADGSSGLSFTHNITCNHKAWICSAAPLMAAPILYQTGYEILKFALYQASNERLNNVTWFNRESTKEQADDCLRLSESVLKDITQNISVPSDAKCFQCREYMRYETSLP